MQRYLLGHSLRPMHEWVNPGAESLTQRIIGLQGGARIRFKDLGQVSPQVFAAQNFRGNLFSWTKGPPFTWIIICNKHRHPEKPKSINNKNNCALESLLQKRRAARTHLSTPVADSGSW